MKPRRCAFTGLNREREDFLGPVGLCGKRLRIVRQLVGCLVSAHHSLTPSASRILLARGEPQPRRVPGVLSISSASASSASRSQLGSMRARGRLCHDGTLAVDPLHSSNRTVSATVRWLMSRRRLLATLGEPSMSKGCVSRPSAFWMDSAWTHSLVRLSRRLRACAALTIGPERLPCLPSSCTSRRLMSSVMLSPVSMRWFRACGASPSGCGR